MNSLSNELNQIDQAELQSLKVNLAQMKKIHSYIPEREAEPWGFFSLFRRSADELTHSYILAYLLDPKRPHGLGDYFLKEFFTLLQKRKPTVNTDYSGAFIEVNTEVSIGSRRIDIIVDMGSSALVIENKIYNSEGEEQTIDIKNEVEKSEDYKNKNNIYVFLTPKGIAAQNKNFITVSYIDLAKIIKGIPFSVAKSVPPKTNFLLSELLNHIEEEFEMSGGEWKLDDKSRLFLDYQNEISDIKKSFEGYLDNIKRMAEDLALASLQADEKDWVYEISKKHFQQLYKKSWTIDKHFYLFFETWLCEERLVDKSFILIMGTYDEKLRQKFCEYEPLIESELKAIGSKYRSQKRGLEFIIAYKEYDLKEDLSDLKTVVGQAYQEHAFFVDKTDKFFNDLKANNI